MNELDLVPPNNWINYLPNLLGLSLCSQQPTPSTLPTALNGTAEAELGGAHTIMSLGILVEFSNDRSGSCFDPLQRNIK